MRIGLEIHVPLLSKTKLFSNQQKSMVIKSEKAPAQKFSDEFDRAELGLIPVIIYILNGRELKIFNNNYQSTKRLNKRCFESAVKIGLLLNCEINKFSKFERKHYFFHDNPVIA